VKPRSLLLFEQSIKSPSTLKNYSDHLRRFLDFSNVEDCDSLVKLPHEKLQELIEDYVIHLKNKINPNSVPVMLQGIKQFFIMNRIPVHWEIINKMFPSKVKSSGTKHWSTEQIRSMLKTSNSIRNSAIIHFLASTGARIGVLDYPLQMKHLEEMDNGCRAIFLYPNTTDEYWTFLTPEANNALEDYFSERKQDGEKFFPESPVFRQTYRLAIEKPKPLQSAGARIIIYRIMNKARIQRTRINRNYDIQMDHGFRKRFNTIMKVNNEVNSNIAEKLLGHKNGLDGVYFKPTKEQCFAEFKKAIPELVIDRAEKLKIKNELQEEKIFKHEIETKTELELMKKELHEQRLMTLKLIRESIKDPEKFTKKLENNY